MPPVRSPSGQATRPDSSWRQTLHRRDVSLRPSEFDDARKVACLLQQAHFNFQRCIRVGGSKPFYNSMGLDPTAVVEVESRDGVGGRLQRGSSAKPVRTARSCRGLFPARAAAFTHQYECLRIARIELKRMAKMGSPLGRMEADDERQHLVSFG